MNSICVFRYGFLVGIQEFAVFWTWKTWIGGWMLRVLSDVTVWVLLGALLGSEEQVRFLLIGNAVVVGAAAAAWAVTASSWDRRDGTYSMLVIAPSSLVPAIMGRTSVWLANGIATSLAAFVFLVAVFRMPLPMPAALFVPAFVVLTCASSFCWALFLGALVARAPRLRNVFLRFSSIILMAFCGVSVPVTFWPSGIQAIAAVLPVTHGLRALRMLFDEGSVPEIITELSLEAVVGMGWLVMSILTMDRLAEMGRADGSIEVAR